MNKQRRKQIDAIASKLEEIKADLEMLRDEEQDAFDNMPESLPQSDRGQAAEHAISELETALSSLEEAFDACQNATAE